MRIHWFFVLMVIFYAAFSNNLDATLKCTADNPKLRNGFSKHKKLTYGILLLFALMIGCVTFPAINLTHETSIVKEWANIIIVLIYCIYAGIVEAILFGKSSLSRIIGLNTAITLLSIIFRYMFQLSEETRTYNFTFPNVALHMVILIFLTSFMWFMAVREIKRNVLK